MLDQSDRPAADRSNGHQHGGVRRFFCRHENVHFYATHSVDVDGELAKLDADGYRPLRSATAEARPGPEAVARHVAATDPAARQAPASR